MTGSLTPKGKFSIKEDLKLETKFNATNSLDDRKASSLSNNKKTNKTNEIEATNENNSKGIFYSKFIYPVCFFAIFNSKGIIELSTGKSADQVHKMKTPSVYSLTGKF